MTELTRTINNINELSTAQSDITSLQESVNNNTTNILTLESYIVSSASNFGVGQNVLQDLTTRNQNTALGDGASTSAYGLTTGSGNVMVGYNSGGGCVTGSNNTFLGANTQLSGATYDVGSIALGAGATINKENQLMVASNVTSFNISGLTASTGTGEGTILDFDSSGYIIPSAGTLNSVSKIDSAVSTLQSYTISDETNFGVGPDVLNQLTTGTQSCW